MGRVRWLRLGIIEGVEELWGVTGGEEATAEGICHEHGNF